MTQEYHDVAVAASNNIFMILDDDDSFQAAVTNGSMPQISLGEITQQLPNITYKKQSTVIEYEAHNITFLIDEEWNNYFTILNEMIARSNGAKEKSRMISLVFMNGLKRPIWKVNFFNAFFSSLGELGYDTQNNVMFSTITISYTHIKTESMLND